MAKQKYTTKELVKKGREYYLPVYFPRDLVLEKGEGSKIWDTDGKDYLDFGAGIAVNSLGHQHSELKKAAHEQLDKLWHTSNVYFTEPTILLAEQLVKTSQFAKKVFFTNSGTEAIEGVIKLVRKFSSKKFHESKREIITFSGSFHGRSMGAVTATAQPKYHEGFEPLPGGFVYCDFNDIDDLKKKMNSNTCAVIIEPIQGEGGIHPVGKEFMKELRSLCNQHQALLVFDEIQAGFGRTGKLYAHEWYDVLPDVIAIAKALGCGMPIGAMLVGEKAKDAMQVGDHGSTFGGNPVMTNVALRALEIINQESFLKTVLETGKYFQEQLSKLNKKIPFCKDIRGFGLMIGCELEGKWENRAKDLTESCRENGLLILQSGTNVLRILPPLNISLNDINEGIKRLEMSL